jgi:hypothetical protein
MNYQRSGPHAGWLRAATLTVLAAACSSVQARSIRFVGRPGFQPTDPATVEILPRPPMRPQDILGQVIVEPEGEPSKETIEDKLREETARMGGSAAVIVCDRLRRVGPVWTGGPWWSGGGEIQPVPGEGISAIVIRYATDVGS